MKTTAMKMVRALGYDLMPLQSHRKPDLSAYNALYSAETLARKPFYNVGAGSFRHPYWTNVDKPSDWYRDHQQQDMIAYDLMELVPLPIADNTGLLVYTSHTMEHIPDDAALHFYREAHRILAPGGLLRVTVPDADLFYRAYRTKDWHFDDMVQKYTDPHRALRICLGVPANQLSLQQLFLWRIATTVSVHHTESNADRMTDEEVDNVFETMPYEEALNYCTSRCDLEAQQRNPGCHVNWWNWDKLSRSLSEAGFNQVRRCAFGQSASPLLRDTQRFDSTRPESSLYVEAQK